MPWHPPESNPCALSCSPSTPSKATLTRPGSRPTPISGRPNLRHLNRFWRKRPTSLKFLVYLKLPWLLSGFGLPPEPLFCCLNHFSSSRAHASSKRVLNEDSQTNDHLHPHSVACLCRRQRRHRSI